MGVRDSKFDEFPLQYVANWVAWNLMSLFAISFVCIIVLEYFDPLFGGWNWALKMELNFPVLVILFGV